MAEFELKALITGVDKLSPALSRMQKNIRGFKRQAEEASKGGLALAGGLAAGLTVSLKAYADQENAATGLKVAMMQANGEVGNSFEKINKLAVGLGNQLPGTTADFQNMMQMLVRQGIPAENILGGVGKATAYLAVQLKKTPEAAAEFAAKMQDATGTASDDMMGLFDTIQKAFYLGVDDTNMLSFFTKTSSVLKMVNKDGLKAAQGLAPISVMMDQMGMQGESAGNALRKVIQSGLDLKKVRATNKGLRKQRIRLDFTDGKGGFGGLDKMFSQLAKLRKLTDTDKTSVLKTLFGDDAETLQVVNALIDKGKDGYDQIQQKMNKQASLNKRVEAQLGTLTNLWEAMTGTATNGLAAIGGAFSSDTKQIVTWLGDLGENFSNFAEKNPDVIRGVVGLVAGLAALKLGFMGVNFALGLVSKTISMSPWGILFRLIAMAAGYIIANWSTVGPWFKEMWDKIGPYFQVGWELMKTVFGWTPLGLIINNWGPVVKWFQDMWAKLKPIIEWFSDGASDTVAAANAAQWGAGGYGAYGTGVPVQGYNPYQINQTGQKKAEGEITVSFKDAPPGMRITDTRSSGIDVNHDVGYTRIGKTGMSG
ncbi:phage tail tape measure protein [Salmonella enterica]|uniref:Phage tail tape measure protein n=1 Tax=Salmonella enterica TaxID=28901 RepID=A0A5T9KZD3_SALER|nr:phage tail tape measure protein [Salmonella enterica]EBF4011865.1 phage tail tape measure protein [Salmonella enterica subsp. enterica serovar Alachua]EEP8163794.1 phage tail tape measure protein [Salmonella enterica subsp. enterica serovar Poona]EKV4490390.1 phage tail tape measure protein [Citrobacter freundii]EBO0293640.1 phage tail tape measure protein [Salmonella enterica subsp. enterica serovar Alachua]